MTTHLVRAPSSATTLLRHLVDDADLAVRLRELPAPAFSALIRQVGLEDAGELVALATTEQLLAAFDEDVFQNDAPGEREQFDPRRFATWLEVLLEAGDAAVAQRFCELSEDFVAHALDTLVLVLDQEALLELLGGSNGRTRFVEKQLENAVSEELDGYVIIARVPDAFDTTMGLIRALDAHERGLLERVLDHCVAASREVTEDLETLGTALTESASLADDVEAERDARRARAGFVEPRDARSFLALARTGATGRTDPATRAYFRTAAQAPTPGLEGSKLSALLDRMEEAEHPPHRAALPASKPHPVSEALRLLRLRDPKAFDARMTELGFLSNVVLAGATREGRRFRPSEAAEAALATVALGAELQTADHSAAGLSLVLEQRLADDLFRIASGELTRRGRPGLVLERAALVAPG
jgi:hypothetical protein